MPISTEKARVLAIVQVVGETIKEFGPDGVPSGHLYAHLSGVITYHTYQSMIDAMVAAKVIKVSNHVITWIGGEK
jgi:hypothetical protein